MEIGHGTDEADFLIGVGYLEIAGRTIGLELGAGNERAEGLLDEFAGRSCAEEIGITQNIGGADRHELDEAQQHTLLPSEFDQEQELRLGLVFHEHAVELNGAESGFDSGIDSLKH